MAENVVLNGREKNVYIYIYKLILFKCWSRDFIIYIKDKHLKLKKLVLNVKYVNVYI